MKEPAEIYKDLKEKIIWLEIKPESTLNLVDLAGFYGVSRNPIAIALTRLDAEEWVVRHGTHFVVCPLTLDRMKEITEIRSVMEVQSNLWAMQRITRQHIAQLRKFQEKVTRLGETATKKDIIRLDLQFHRILYQATQNNQLAQMLERMLSHYLRFWLASRHNISKEVFFAEALEMIQAIEAGDEVRLRAASAEHIKVSMDEILAVR